MEVSNRKHSDENQNMLHFPVWRTVVIGSLLMVGFYLFWLIPSLNDIKETSLAHQLEVAEKIEIELKEVVLNHPENRLDELYLFVLPKLRNNVTFDTLDQNGLLSFLDGRNDVREFSIADMAGNEKIRIAQGAAVSASEMKNTAREKYFRKAVATGFSLEAEHANEDNAKVITVAKRVIVPELGSFVFLMRVDISQRLKDFSFNLKKKENELMFITDGSGTIIDHYDSSKIGSSAYEYDFVRSALALSESGGDDYEVGAYSDPDGVKYQATALLFEPVRFVIVIQERYKDFWQSWNRFIFLAFVGIGFFIGLTMFSTNNTIKMFYFSRQLLREKNRTESIIANLETGIIEYDANFRITLANPKAEAMLGIPREKMVGTEVRSDKMTAHPELKPLIQVFYPALADKVKKIQDRDGTLRTLEIKIRDELDVQVTTIPIFDSTNNAFRYLKVLRDVSRENAIAHSKSEFISVAAHQLRTPLSAIKWVFRMVLDEDAGAINAEQRDFLQKGYDSNERIIKLVGDMLDVARIEEGRFGFEFYYVDLTELIAKTIEAFKIKAQEKNIKLIFAESEKLAPIKIDPVKIELVLQNLIDNAVKYTRLNGIVTIKTEVTGTYVQVSIADNGIGVQADQKNRLFGKFFRGTNAVKLATEGTGLGLFIVKNILLRHGGTIRIDTEENKGTTFYFTLPLEEKFIPRENELVEFVEGL